MNVNTNTQTGPSFTLSNRLMRLVWGVCYWLLFRFSPRPLHPWRSFLLRCFGAEVGKGVHVYPKTMVWAPWNLILDDQCGVADGVILYSQGRILIGRNAVISQGAHLCAGTHDYETRGFPLVTAPIEIGAEAWIAAECFIMPGIKVGEGTVVGARSVVTKDLPPWMVCAGHPCRVIKPRNVIK